MTAGTKGFVGRCYRFSLKLGWSGLRSRSRRAALARLINPISYPRATEFSLALSQLALDQSQRVLDIGSPKLLFLFLAEHTSLELHATDILPNFIDPARMFLEKLGRGAEIGQRLVLATQDARRLTYEDGSFDRVYSLSVLEHIPDDGDAAAMREIGRVLRPGGRAFVTVPYALRGYSETFVRHDVYERRHNGSGPLFYQRRYDDDALQRRLVDPSGLKAAALTYFGEPGLRIDPWWNRLPLATRAPLLWAQPVLERLFLQVLQPARRDRAIGVAITLEKV